MIIYFLKIKFLPIFRHEWEECRLGCVLTVWGGQLCSPARSSARCHWLWRHHGAEVTSGVAQAQWGAVTEARVPDQRKVDTLKLGQTQVLPPPRLDILDTEIRHDTSRCRSRLLWRHEPINYDRSPENMSQTEHMELLQTLTGLTG